MIIIGEIELQTEEDVEKFFQEFKKKVFTKAQETFYNVFYNFAFDCFKRSIKLQNMVEERLHSKDFFTYALISFEEYEDLDKIDLRIARYDDKKIKKKEELIFFQCVDICFGNIDTLYQRLEFEDMK